MVITVFEFNRFIALLQARLESSERSGAKDNEEDFAGMLPHSL